MTKEQKSKLKDAIEVLKTQGKPQDNLDLIAGLLRAILKDMK